MNHLKMSPGFKPPRLFGSSGFVVAAVLLTAFINLGCASSQHQFATPDEAVQSLVGAVRAHDSKQLKQILGPQTEEVLSSGDEVADRQTGERFLVAFDEKHQLVKIDNNTVTLNVGNSDWPLPIPAVMDQESGKWLFDTEAGKEEIINRRIGRNELDVIQVCHAAVDAQIEYTQRDPNGDGIPEYATKFISDPGKKNGLYWKTAEGESPSPLGPLVGQAVEEGYTSARAESGKPNPYHGYYYRLLTSQGANAPGAEFSYLVDGKLIGGFAIIAWPVQYGSSGIMTFIVNHRGVVYQKDLGPETDKVAKAIASFDPGAGWTKAE